MQQTHHNRHWKQKCTNVNSIGLLFEKWTTYWTRQNISVLDDMWWDSLIETHLCDIGRRQQYSILHQQFNKKVDFHCILSDVDTLCLVSFFAIFLSILDQYLSRREKNRLWNCHFVENLVNGKSRNTAEGKQNEKKRME